MRLSWFAPIGLLAATIGIALANDPSKNVSAKAQQDLVHIDPIQLTDAVPKAVTIKYRLPAGHLGPSQIVTVCLALPDNKGGQQTHKLDSFLPFSPPKTDGTREATVVVPNEVGKLVAHAKQASVFLQCDQTKQSEADQAQAVGSVKLLNANLRY